MRKLIFCSIIIPCLVSCESNTQTNGNSEMVMGSPKSVVTDQLNTENDKGPLAYAPQVPQVQDGDTVEIKIDVKHRLYHVADGVRFTAWVYGDSIPGPVVALRVGQTVKFSMTDRSNDTMGMSINMQPMSHSIDFHAAMVNPEDKYRSISPGETISFSWTANYPGVFMYHCGTPMVLLHMISGMIGMVIVEPKGGYPDKADREFAIVQNEYYLKKQGLVSVPDLDAANLKQPTYVTFNGKAGQYLLHPLHVKTGERIRVYFLNAGPNNATSFHIIGTILDKVWIDGNPANQFVGMQAVYLGPAQGAIMEFVLPEKGRYTFVDHSFADVGLGAVGTFVAE